MKRYQTNSSQIRSIAYDIATAEMLVEFGEKLTPYLYRNVPLQRVAEVMFFDSLGNSFDVLIKKGGFPYQRLTPEEYAAKLNPPKEEPETK